MKIRFLRAGFGVLCLLMSIESNAAGTLHLETSVVVVDTDDQEGTLGVRNSANLPLLMISKVESIPEDPQDLLLVNPPIARVEPGDTQIVRFLLKPRGADQPEISTEHLMRASFEGIPPKETNKVNFSIRQNIPVIVHPSRLAKEDEPWKLLTWQREADGLSVKNPSPYVVRLTPALTLLPSQTSASLPRTYVLPGESLHVSVKAMSAADTQVRLHPASRYGFVEGEYEAPLTSAAAPTPAK
jgi:P pilus assembly chaperone PapD